MNNNRYGVYSSGTLNVFNSIIVNNATDILCQPGTVQGSNNLSTFTEWGSNPEDNFLFHSELPLFIDVKNGDYRLAPGSQVIDKGDSQYAYDVGMDVNSRDLAGQWRFTGATIDIGAYEYDFSFVVSQSLIYQNNVAFQWLMPENAETMRLTWISGVTSTVLGTFADASSYSWNTTHHADGPGVLKVEYFDKNNKLTTLENFAATIINDANIVIHRGEITANETWSKDKVHLVVGKFDVKSGATLTIAEETVVKFWKSAYLNVNFGANLNILRNAVMTRAEDDSVSGDSNKDGNLSVPKNGNTYFRGTGNIQIDPNAELKYLNQTRSGILTTSETWLGGQVYNITGTVTVPAGVTLTILPGAILKFDKDCSLVVNSGGTLIAEGNAAQPLVFTSIKDDAYGGDTNEDGGNTQPQPGD